MICALVQNNTVVEIENIPDDGGVSYSALANQYQCVIDTTDMDPTPQVGWVLNGTVLEAGDASSINWFITKLAFRERFSITELTAVYTAMPSNPILQVILDNLSVSTYVDLSRQDTIQGVALLEQMGLIAAGRANIILTTPPTAIEVYHP